MILKLLAEEGKMHGYEMVQCVRAQSNDKILIKDGSLYPALQKMTEDGLLSFREEIVGGRVRKYYYLTPKGRKQAAASMKELEDFITTIAQVVFPKAKTKLI